VEGQAIHVTPLSFGARQLINKTANIQCIFRQPLFTCHSV